MSWYRQQLEDWLAELDVEADMVFDIGGKQNPVKDRVKSWDVNYYWIFDLPEWDLEDEETDHKPSDWVKLGDKADVIFCLEVFEYVLNPVEAIRNIYYAMNRDSVAYVTFPFAYPHHNELESDSLRYTETFIKRVLDEKILTEELYLTDIWYRTDKSGLLREFYKADGMKMAKEYNNHDVTGFICEMRKQ